MSGTWIVLTQNDSVENIALIHGHLPETIWHDARNDSLRNKRKSMHVLYAGDRLFVPDIEAKTASCATGQRHIFRRKAVPSQLQVKLVFREQIIANRPCQIDIPGRPPHATQTDADGMVTVPVMPDAAEGSISVELENGETLKLPLSPRSLDPVDTLSGLRQRLQNLGYVAATLPEPLSLALSLALGQFQLAQGLARTGDLDEATRKALLETHGC